MKLQITKENLSKLTHHKQVMFAVFCAEQVTHLLDDKTREPSLKAIEVTKKWLVGKASVEQCKKAAYAYAYAADAAYAAADAAADAATAAVYAAANADAAAAAAYAAYAAYAAAYAAAKAKEDKQRIIQEQWNYYDQLLNMDKYAEEYLLTQSP